VRQFRSVAVKPNQRECIQAVRSSEEKSLEASIRELADRIGRPVFCTCGESGIAIFDPRERQSSELIQIPAYPVHGPIDVVGAGDSTSAAIACAIASGASLETAADFGNLVASITIQQIGTTGTASPGQIRRRWRELHETKPHFTEPRP
jgi:sugar/nucleoside kinase (ribokinase family)